jgi:hypothetical protein
MGTYQRPFLAPFRTCHTKGWSRPESVIHVGRCERRLTDHKTDIAHEKIIVRRINQLDSPILRKRTYDGLPHLVAL